LNIKSTQHWPGMLTSLAVSENPTDEGRALGTSSHDDKVIVLKNKLLTYFK
jgi:hypothetical protein